MLTATSVDIEVEELRAAVKAYLVEHFTEGEREDTAASIVSSRKAAVALLPSDWEGAMQRFLRERLPGLDLNVHCLRAAVEEYFCRRRNSRALISESRQA